MRRVEPVLLAVALLLAGCAGLIRQEAPASPFRDPALTVEEAARAITPGRSDKREVEQRLGPAQRLEFASGYEVWVYRGPEPQAQNKDQAADGPELVILFDPPGTVRKLRARPASAQLTQGKAGQLR